MNATPRAFVVTPLLVLMCLAVPAARAQSFSGLGFLPGGTQSSASRANRDGSVIVGSASNHAYRWTSAGGMVDLGTLPGGTYSYAADVSDDGSVVVGMSSASAGPRAFRWTSAGMVDLGLPVDGGGDGEALDSYGHAVSGDGAVVAGFSSPINDAFRWTSNGGMLSLGTLIPGVGYSMGNDCNSDGSVLAGVSTGANDDHAIRWTVADGLQDLGTLPGGTTSQGTGVSADGATIVGFGGTSGFAQIRAFRWTSAGGMVSLGTLPGMASRAYGVSGNGQVVVGALMSPDHAMLWTSSLGMVDLNTYLPSLGINLTGWILTAANGVSTDGRTLVGSGTHNGLTEAWVAHLSSPTAAGGVPDGGEVPGPPLTIDKSTTPGDLVMSWGHSCHPSDSDYAVYEGVLGDFASHAPRQCGTGGATSVSLTPASDSRYYLVVPLSPDGAEGSYGTRSNGAQRPPSASSCQPQVFTGCM